MSNYLLDIINVICTSTLIALSFVDNISKRSFQKKPKYLRLLLDQLKRIRTKIVIIIIVGATTSWVNYQKNLNTSKEKNIAEANFKKELNKRDAINQRDLNESLSRATKAASSASAETMAKYYLKYDSPQHKIEKIIQDTINRKVVTNTFDAKPDFDISEIKFIKLRNDSLVFDFKLDCKKTAIQNLNLKMQLLLLKRGYYNHIPQIIGFMPPGVNMSSNTSEVIRNVSVTTLTNIYQAYFHIYGEYYYNNSKIPVEFVFFYDFKESTYGIPGNKQSVLELFKQQIDY